MVEPEIEEDGGDGDRAGGDRDGSIRRGSSLIRRRRRSEGLDPTEIAATIAGDEEDNAVDDEDDVRTMVAAN